MYIESFCPLHSVSNPNDSLNSKTNIPTASNTMRMNNKEHSRKVPLGQSDALLLKFPEK